jgi:hypothetical protein
MYENNAEQNFHPHYCLFSIKTITLSCDLALESTLAPRVAILR